MSNRSLFEEFLIFELQTIKDQTDDDGNPLTELQKAYSIITTLAAGGDSMAESTFLNYTHALEIDSSIFEELTAFVWGMGYFRVYCDCSTSPVDSAIHDTHNCVSCRMIDSGPFQQGHKEWLNNTEDYIKVGSDIRGLKHELQLDD